MRSILFLAVLIFLAGCGKVHDDKLPAGLVKDSVIPTEKMVQVLADMHTVEAGLHLDRNTGKDVKSMQEFYYKGICSRYKMSTRRLKLNLAWYQQDQESFEKIYDDVIKELDSREKKAASAK